jgi:hypothetical protein
MKNYQIILTAIISYTIGYLIIDGTAQQYVYFAGPLNELGCAVAALTMGTLCTICYDWKSLLNYLNK